MLDKAKVFSHCLDRWNISDERTQYFEANFDEWFSQLPEDIQEITLQLLELFEYFPQKKVNDYLYDLRSKLEAKAKLDPDETIYTPLPSIKGISNSSGDYLYTYRQLHNISKFKIVLDLKTYITSEPEKYKKVTNIVIVDDYCGSGESLKTFVELHVDCLKGKHIYYVITYLMLESMPLIDNISKEYDVAIDVIYINTGTKAFNNVNFSGKEDDFRALVKRRSKKLNIPHKYRLGKYESESLVSFYNDTPNNTIGLFWHDSDKYFSIFPREFENTEGLKRPTPNNLKSQKATRNAQNYSSARRKAQYE